VQDAGRDILSPPPADGSGGSGRDPGAGGA
jgi:hypothetical protein